MDNYFQEQNEEFEEDEVDDQLLPEFEVVVVGTWKTIVEAHSAEEAEEIVMDHHFDPAYLKENVRVYSTKQV